MPPADSVRTEADLPRVLATVYITPGSLRLSSPRVDTLEEAEEKLRRLLGARAEKAQRVAAPLPLPFLDAEIWTARVPGGVDHAISGQLARETVEAYYENHWIHRPRQGLDNLSPLSAGQNAWRGDVVARAKLEAVVRSASNWAAAPAQRRSIKAIRSTASAAGSASSQAIPTPSTFRIFHAPVPPNSSRWSRKSSVIHCWLKRSSQPGGYATIHLPRGSPTNYSAGRSSDLPRSISPRSLPL